VKLNCHVVAAAPEELHVAEAQERLLLARVPQAEVRLKVCGDEQRGGPLHVGGADEDV
jgi:hypothetical protein